MQIQDSAEKKQMPTTIAAPIAAPTQDAWGDFSRKTKDRTGQNIIKTGGFAYCHICAEALRRVSPTIKWCNDCGNGFCDDHGNFSQRVAKCLECGMTQTKLREILGGRMGIDPDDFKQIRKYKTAFTDGRKL
jgi:hypothetical protein